MAALHVLSPVQPFPAQLPRIAYMVVHAALQLVVFVLYVCAVDLDVSWWRDEGALCDAEVPCSLEINGDVCESMRTDLEWLFWGHCIGVAVAVNKVVVVLGLLAAGTEAGLGMLLAVPAAQHGRHSERNSRLLVCAAWGFSLCLDAGLLFSLCCQVVVTHVRSADYKEVSNVLATMPIMPIMPTIPTMPTM
ncbi:MAG: hypothetical protein P8J32_09170 [bacterium]|nr:hypothetical protein [bacterium]